MGGFEFFGQHLAFRRCEAAHHARPFFGPGGADVDFDDVGKLAEREARIVGCEVVEGDHIARRFQALAGGDDAVFGLHRFQNLGHGLVWGQQGEQIFKQDLAGAIHEGAAVIANRLDTEEQRTIEGGAAGKFRVGVEVVFDTVAEKDFVSEHFLRAVKNWLAGNETLSRQGEEVRVRGFLGGSCWFHAFYIGVALAELQAKPGGCHPGCGKLKALPPCAFDGFVSNIKVFPMAMLPGWPFAPSKTPGAQNKDSLKHRSRFAFSNSIQPRWGLVCR